MAAPANGDAQKLERALALGGTSEIVLTGGAPSSEYVQHLLNQNLLAGRDALNEMLKAGAAGDERGAAADRKALADAGPALPVRGSTLPLEPRARPHVPLRRRTSSRSTAGSAPRGQRPDAPDGLRHRRQRGGGAPGRGQGRADGFRLRLEQGVVDSNLESLLVTGRPPEEGGVKVNTADLFARSEAQGVKWVTVRGAGAEAALAGVSLGADVRQRVKDDLAAGYAVVVPTKPVDVGGVKAGGWWRVDPRTGNALGMTEAGGATFAEYALQITASLAVGMDVHRLWRPGGQRARRSSACRVAPWRRRS